MKKRTNKDLKQIYDGIFKKGETRHFSKNVEQKGSLPVDTREALATTTWKGKRVLDVGCGTGLFAHEAAKRGASVLAIDYSKKGIETARGTHVHKDLEFRCEDILKSGVLSEKFDVIVSLGTLEHMDAPLDVLRLYKKMLRPKGEIVLTCPNWVNPRGFMLMTLKHLFDAPITLADIHYFSPHTFEGWAKKLGMRLDWKTFSTGRAAGAELIADLEKRIPNVLRDAKLRRDPNGLAALLAWLKDDALTYPWSGSHIGATGIYHFQK